jgi:hypothetical protein
MAAVRVTWVKLAAGNSGTPVVVALLLGDAEPLEAPDVEVAATGLEKDVTVSVLPGPEPVVSRLGTALSLATVLVTSVETVGKGKVGIAEAGTLMVGRETMPEMDDVMFHPTSPL